FLHPLFNHAHVFSTGAVGQVRNVDQEWFQIGEQRLGGKLCLHLRIAAEHYVFIQQATRERLVVSDVDFVLVVSNGHVLDRAQQQLALLDVIGGVLIVHVEITKI